MRALPYSLNEVLVLDRTRSKHLVILLLLVDLVHHLALRLGTREGLRLPALEDLQLRGLGGVDVCAGLLSLLPVLFAGVRRPGVHLLMLRLDDLQVRAVDRRRGCLIAHIVRVSGLGGHVHSATGVDAQILTLCEILVRLVT